MVFLLFFLLLLFSFAVAIYFIPTFVAKYRNHHNLSAIFLMNLFFGWSFIGWALSLVWAMTRVISTSQPIVYLQGSRC
ncbi:MAG: superinfection immunity protein [Gammaproteobacteria bacterium]|nr:superinfection immunity protein [Gammaproteobacteria bacterium]